MSQNASSSGNASNCSPDAESSATQEDLVSLSYLIAKKKTAEGWDEADYAQARKIGLIVDDSPSSAR